MPVLEAMAAGVPVIAANRSAMPEVAGDAALLIDPASDDELESALQLLATDFALRDQLIDKGQKRVAQFNWPRAVRETIDVYRELTAG